VKCFAEGRFEPEIAWPLSEVSTSRLARVALAKLHEQVEVNRPEDDVALKVSDFLAQRLLSNLRENGVRYDLAEAALAVGSDKIRDAAKRAGALNAASERRPGDFVKTVTAATRPINISKGHAGGEVNVDLFEDDAERALWAEYCRVKAEADALRGGRGSYDELRYYHEVLALLGQLVQTIDRFFDDVLVMHEDEKIRRNRLALCWQLSQLFRRIADFTLIVQA
jgi:glycyl-tRNA synthetase beta chain